LGIIARRMKAAFGRFLGGMTLLAVLLYAGDYVSVRYRVPGRREVFDNVMVKPLYVIHQKNGKVEYQFGLPQNEVCVRSLFPHLGYAPCWYVRRHSERRIDI
jgi:hypothetical protein